MKWLKKWLKSAAVGGSGHLSSPTHLLHLGATGECVAVTFGLHLLYGLIIGGLPPAWTCEARSQKSERRPEESFS
jgi:hypothetical protein